MGGPGPPSWFTPGRLLLMFCVMNLFIYIDRGVIARWGRGFISCALGKSLYQRVGGADVAGQRSISPCTIAPLMSCKLMPAVAAASAAAATASMVRPTARRRKATAFRQGAVPSATFCH